MKQKHGFLTRGLVLCLALWMTMGVTAGVTAENRPVSGGNVSMHVYMVMNKEVTVPNVELAYTIEPGFLINATAGKPQVLAGVGSMPTLDKVKFSSTDTTYESVQSGDALTLGTGQKYAKQVLNIDMTGISFSNPGIYRYVINQGMASFPNVSLDTNHQRQLDVYVIGDEDGVLQVASTVLHPSADILASGSYPNKDGGFQNTATVDDSRTLTVANTVNGNQGNYQRPFAFRINIQDDLNGERSYSVTGDLNGGANAMVPETEDGFVEAEYSLKHYESITIAGLPPDAAYTITSLISDDEGYDVSYSLNEGQSVDGKTTGEQYLTAGNQSVTFRHERVVAVATGMTVTAGAVANNEIPLSIVIAANATLGGADAQQGTISIPITAPVSTTLLIHWSKVNTGATGTPGTPGAAGEDAVVFSLYAPSGTVFVNGAGSLTIQTAAYKGTAAITSGATYVWKKYVSGAWTTITGQTSSSLSVAGSTVDGVASFQCAMTYDGETYTDTISLTDKTDNYQAAIESSGGDVFKNAIGSSTLLCRLFQNGVEVDADGTDYTYKWYRRDKDGNALDSGAVFATGKSITIDGDDVTIKTTFICEVE